MSRHQCRVLVDALSVTSGGGKSYAVNLLRELSRDHRGLDFTILLPDDALEGVECGRVHLQRLRLPATGSPLRLAARLAYEELVIPVRGRRFDVTYAVADLVSVIPSSPTVVALRNLNIYDHAYYGGTRLKTLRMLAGAGARRATRTIFPSQAAADLIGTTLRLDPKRVRIVPHGVDVDAFDEIGAFQSTRPYLFLPSAIERHKNLEILVEALPRFGDKELEIRVAGSWDTDPTYHQMLHERAARLGVADRFITMGPVPYSQIAALYRGAKALVFPSRLETFGHPILEAMALGTPILASRIPAFLEIAGEAAAFFDPAAPTDLVRVVDELDRRGSITTDRVSKGWQRVRSFSWRESTDRLCEVLEEAAFAQ